MSTNNQFNAFISQDNFIDPINDKKAEVVYSDKFVNGSVFDEEFIQKERILSKSAKTIVFDLDETMRGWDQNKNEGFLRHSLKNVLDQLKDKDYRLIIWSASIRPSIQQTLNKYPGFDKYFAHIISSENYSYSFLSESTRDYLHKISPNYYHLLKAVQADNIDPDTGRPFYRPTKNIALFDWSLLIDDDPNIIEEGQTFGFNSMRIIPYKYENPDNADLLPEKLIKIIEDDFEQNMAQRIIANVEGKPSLPEHNYIVED